MLGFINYSLPGGGGHQDMAKTPLSGDRASGAEFEKVLSAALTQSETTTDDLDLPVDDAQVDAPDAAAEDRTTAIGSEGSDSKMRPDGATPDPVGTTPGPVGARPDTVGATPDPYGVISQGSRSAREMRNPTRNGLDLAADLNNAMAQSQTAPRPMTDPRLPDAFESGLRGKISQNQPPDPKNVFNIADPAKLRPARSKDADSLSEVRQRHDYVDLQSGRYATVVPRLSGSVDHSEGSPKATKLERTAGTEVSSSLPKIVDTTSPGKASELIENTISRLPEGALDANPGTSNNAPVFTSGGRARPTEIHVTHQEESPTKQKYETGNMQLAQSRKSVFVSDTGIGRDTASVKQSGLRASNWSVDTRHNVAVSRCNLAPGKPTQTDLNVPKQPKAQSLIATEGFDGDVYETHTRSTSRMDSRKNIESTDNLSAPMALSPNRPENRMSRVATQVGYSVDYESVLRPREYFHDGADGRSDTGGMRVTERGDTLKWRAIADSSMPGKDIRGSVVSFHAASHDVPLAQSSDKTASWTERHLELVAASHVEARPASGPPVAAQNMTGAGNHAASVIRQMIEVSGQMRDGPVEVSLSPEELGRVRMQIVSGDQGVVMHITAERGETLEMLRRHIDQLHRDLSAMGHENPRFSFDREGAQDQRRARPEVEADQIVDSQTSTQHPAAASNARKDRVDIRI